MSRGKARQQWFELWAELTALLTEQGFSLKELADKLRLFTLGCLADIFSKMNEVSLLLSEQRWQHCSQRQIWASMQMLLGFQKTYICQPERGSFPMFKACFPRFHKNMLWVLTHHEFIVILKQIRIKKYFSILILDMMNIARYSSHKQMIWGVFDSFYVYEDVLRPKQEENDSCKSYFLL